MKDYILKRCLMLAEFIVENKATVRNAAKRFGVSKSTVHTVLSISVGWCGALNLAEYKAFKAKTENLFSPFFLTSDI